MHTDLPVLDSISIASPCSASWDAMEGDDTRRFCGDCHLHVYNIAGMTRAEAETLIATHEGRLCMRLFRRADGTVLTNDCPVGLAALKRSLVRSAATVTAAAVFVALCGLRVLTFGMTAGPGPITTLIHQMIPKPAFSPPVAGLVKAAREEMGDVCEAPMVPGPPPATK